MEWEGFQTKFASAYDWANQCCRGALEVLQWAVRHFFQVRAGEAAASIAYYALFSLFPLLLVLVSIVGYVLVNTEAPDQVLEFIAQFIPIARPYIQENLLHILEQHSSIGLIGLTILVWAASSVFLTLARNINRAWPGAPAHSYLRGRLLAIGMIGVISLLLILSVLFTTALRLLDRFNIPFRGSNQIYDTLSCALVSTIVPWLLAFLIFLSLYKWVPNTTVRRSEAFWGAVVATVAWELSAIVFSWYFSSGLAQYELLYGSLGTIIGIMTWTFVSAAITLFGAHISAAVAVYNRRHSEEPAPNQEEGG
jgi:membrane protein